MEVPATSYVCVECTPSLVILQAQQIIHRLDYNTFKCTCYFVRSKLLLRYLCFIRSVFKLP